MEYSLYSQCHWVRWSCFSQLVDSRHGKSSVEFVFREDLKPAHREQLGRSSGSKPGLIMSSKLYVGNLSFDVTENDLRDMLSPHGPVNEVNVIMDRETGRARGFAFATMNTAEGAKAAILALNGKAWKGRALTVNEARPREERGGSSRGYSASRPR
jgi:RNA recognition motif-containing protein